jgi:hypothetical protein
MGWNAGLYQTVNVTPGQVYQADIGWSAPRCNFTLCYDMERRIGLDPTGGTDPQAGSVVWGRAEPGPDKWPDLTVAARASVLKMTVFLMVNHPSSHGQDEIYLDALGVWPDTSQPAVTNTPLPTYTPTRRPPTRTPVPAAAQATAVVAAEPTPAATALPSPTAVITPTNTATPFRTPTATPNVTIAPLNDVLGPVAQVAGGIEGGELVRVSRLQSVEQGRRAEVGPERWLLVVAAAAVVVAFAAGGIALVVWLRGAGRRAG